MFNHKKIRDRADATEIDVMKWIMTHELTSKNLETHEKLAMLSDFKEEIKKENKKKQKEGGKLGANITNGATPSLHVERTRSNSTWTDAQIAQKAGVGLGTIGRWNYVDNSGDEDLRQKMRSGEIKIGTAYREIKAWILDIQLGRRNLSAIQKISITEQYRSFYEKQAKERQAAAGGDKKSESYQKSVPQNLGEAVPKKKHAGETVTELAGIANVNPETYRQGVKILNSDNEEVKKKVMSGEMSINAVDVVLLCI